MMNENVPNKNKNQISWILNSIGLNLSYTGSFIWSISFQNLKYLDKPIKCLEMRAKIKSVRTINEIFILFSFTFKNRTWFPHSSILMKNVFFGYFKCQISKCQDLSEILPPILAVTMPTTRLSSTRALAVNK